MDVDRLQFFELLPTLIKTISTSHFIALDLELSGIPTKTSYRSKVSLNEYYQELRLAANEYHILQVGLTFVEEDVGQKRYICRPFNFNLSPLVPCVKYSPAIDRKFSYSSSAVEFLLSHGYQIDLAFVKGVPYLSPKEESVARQLALQKWDREAIPNMVINADDIAAQTFLKRVQNEVSRWKKDGLPDREFYNITGPNTAPLSRFQRRLVHQIIRSEHPDLDTVSRDDCVTVKWRNERERETTKKAISSRVTQALFTQIGFRWLADAIAGKDVSQLDPTLCGNKIEGEPHLRTREQFTSRLQELKAMVCGRHKIIIGHNCFIDLVYFYKTFFGDLPESLEDFQFSISQLFPFVIDTKYLATSVDGSRSRHNSQLFQLDDAFDQSTSVNIETPPGYGQYTGPKFHEAGWDSFVTAKVFLRLSKQLDVNSSIDDSLTSPTIAEEKDTDREKTGRKRRKGKLAQKSAEAQAETMSRFSHSNPFEKLESLENETQNQKPRIFPPGDKSISSIQDDSLHSGTAVERTSTSSARVTCDSKGEGGLIPRWESQFWDKYANKLRAYGAEAEVLDLASHPLKRHNREFEMKNTDNPQQTNKCEVIEILNNDKKEDSLFWTLLQRILRLG